MRNSPTKDQVTDILGGVFIGATLAVIVTLAVVSVNEVVSETETETETETSSSETAPGPTSPAKPSESTVVIILPGDSEIDPTTPQQPEEDDPNWDCRIHGNQMCGVDINGVPYVIQFVNGYPVSAVPRA